MELSRRPSARSAPIPGPPRPTVGVQFSSEAFEAVYREMWPAVVDYLRFRIGQVEAEDVAADVFSRAWAARDQYDPHRAAPAAWVWGIARNAARLWWRGHAAPTVALTDDVAVDMGLLDRAVHADAMARVAEAVARLDPIDQDIVALRFGGGLPHRDVGAAVGLAEAAVATRLHRAIRRLRIALEGSESP